MRCFESGEPKMLNEISIKNFAIIEQLDVRFENGLTVLTGETGAGKSIIIDAVQLIAGGRGSQRFIRHGANRAELEGHFSIDDPKHPVIRTLQQFGIEVEDGVIILRRDLNSNGKNVCRINGNLVTIAVLREVGNQIIDIHGQHENQELMHERRHIHLLDQFSGNKMEEAYASYLELYNKYLKLKRKLEAADENEQQVAQRIDLYSFQLKEINEAQLEIGEEEKLEDEQLKLQNFNRIYERLNTAYESISGDSRALDWVGSAMSDMEDAAEVDRDLANQLESISTSFYTLQETAHDLRNRIDDLEFDPARLDIVEERLALHIALKRKYGNTTEDILIYRDKIADELETLINRDERLLVEQEKLNQLKKDLEIDAEELSIIRRNSAEKLRSRNFGAASTTTYGKSIIQSHDRP